MRRVSASMDESARMSVRISWPTACSFSRSSRCRSCKFMKDSDLLTQSAERFVIFWSLQIASPFN